MFSNRGSTKQHFSRLRVGAKLALVLLAVWSTLLAGSVQASSSVSLDELALELGERTQRVPEFQFIREEAAKLGVRAYLFGGTAAAYSHYVKWDVEREKGAAKYQPQRFDYDYTNIYRSTQDLDIVIDGTPKQAEALRAKLQEKFPHLQGSKANSAWEVRLLNQSMGDKLAILNNPDFLKQHSDSNSTGMVEITKTPAGEKPVRDVMDWNSPAPNFLKDVHEGRLHYYFNPEHGTTLFAKQGRNPPILSVIRYLTKAFQFQLELRPEDLARVKQVIDEFDPKGPDLKNSYVRHWLLEKDNGRKLVQNAVNMEFARTTLDQLGLREKLLKIEGSRPNTVGSLGWWLNKKPLPSMPVGLGKGKTAQELGIDVVAHETNNFLAYESITKSPSGEPNVFVSRENSPGEAAAHGEGFYTQTGRTGAAGTGITIRFRLDPRARHGHDFTTAGTYVVVKNKNAMKVIPESLDWDLPRYLSFMLNNTTIDPSDRALFEKLNRRLVNRKFSYAPGEIERYMREPLAAMAREGKLVYFGAMKTLLKEFPAVRPYAEALVREHVSEVASARSAAGKTLPITELKGLADVFPGAEPVVSDALKKGLIAALESPAPVDFAELDLLRRFFPEMVQDTLTNHFEKMAEHRSWTPAEVERLRAAARAKIPQLRKLSKYINAKPATTCAVHFAGLKPRERAGTVLVGGGMLGVVAAAQAIERKNFMDDLNTADERLAALTRAIKAAKTEEEVAAVLAALDGHAPLRISSALAEKFRKDVGAALLAELPRVLALKPKAPVLESYGRWLNPGDGRDPLWPALQEAGAGAASFLRLLAIEDRTSGDLGEIQHREWLQASGPFFRTRPSADEIKAMYEGQVYENSAMNSQLEGIAQAKNAADVIALYPPQTERGQRLSGYAGTRTWRNAYKALEELPATAADLEALKASTLNGWSPVLTLQLKLARNPQELVSFITPNLPAEGVRRIAERLDSFPKREAIRSADFDGAKRACRVIETCKEIIALALRNAHTAEDFLRAANPLLDTPSFEYAMAFGALIAANADRFFALEPTAEQMLALKKILQPTAHWNAFAPRAAALARDADQLYAALYPLPRENNAEAREFYTKLTAAEGKRFEAMKISPELLEKARKEALFSKTLTPLLGAAARQAGTPAEFLRTLDRPERFREDIYRQVTLPVWDEAADRFLAMNPTSAELRAARDQGAPIEFYAERRKFRTAPDWQSAVASVADNGAGWITRMENSIADRIAKGERDAVAASVKEWQKSAARADAGAVGRLVATLANQPGEILKLVEASSHQGLANDVYRAFLTLKPSPQQHLEFQKRVSSAEAWGAVAASCTTLSQTVNEAAACYRRSSEIRMNEKQEEELLRPLIERATALGITPAEAAEADSHFDRVGPIVALKRAALPNLKNPDDFFTAFTPGVERPSESYLQEVSALWNEAAASFAASRPTPAHLERLNKVPLVSAHRQNILKAVAAAAAR